MLPPPKKSWNDQLAVRSVTELVGSTKIDEMTKSPAVHWKAVWPPAGMVPQPSVALQ